MQGKYFLSFSSNGDLRRERCNNGNLESNHYFWNLFTRDTGEFLIIFHRGVKLNPPVLGTLELPLLAAQSQSHSTERRRDIYFKYLNRRQGRESNTATHGSENYYYIHHHILDISTKFTPVVSKRKAVCDGIDWIRLERHQASSR